MAVSSSRTRTIYGERITFYNDAGTLTWIIGSDPATHTATWSFPATDTAFDIAVDSNGDWVVVYVDGSGNLQRKVGTIDGTAWA